MRRGGGGGGIRANTPIKKDETALGLFGAAVLKVQSMRITAGERVTVPRGGEGGDEEGRQ